MGWCGGLLRGRDLFWYLVVVGQRVRGTRGSMWGPFFVVVVVVVFVVVGVVVVVFCSWWCDSSVFVMSIDYINMLSYDICFIWIIVSVLIGWREEKVDHERG